MCRYEIMTLGLCLNFQYVTVTVEDDLNCFESEITINELFVKKKKHNYKQVLSFLIKQLASAFKLSILSQNSNNNYHFDVQ